MIFAKILLKYCIKTVELAKNTKCNNNYAKMIFAKILLNNGIIYGSMNLKGGN